MALYEVTGPDGGVYQFEGPEGATDAQLNAYVQNTLAVEGSEPPVANPAPQAQTSDTMADRGRLLMDQTMQGIPLAGTFTDEVTDALGAAGAKLYDKTLGDNALSDLSVKDLYGQAREGTTERLKQQQAAHPVASALAQFSGGVAGGGAAASTQAGTALTNSLRSGNALSRIAKGIGAGGVASGLYGAGAAEDGSALEGFKQALPVGAAVGGAIPAAGALLDLAKAPLRPAISEGKQAVAQLASKYGIPLGLDDLSDSKFYKTLISEGESIPLSGSAKHYEAQQKAFTNAVGKSIGVEDAKALTPEIMDEAYQKLGKNFDDLTKGKTFQINKDVADQITEVMDIADNGGYGADGQRLLGKYLSDLGVTTDMKGEVAGETLAKLRSKLNGIARRGSDPNATSLARDVENIISDFISGDAPEALQKAKYQYKNFIAIEPLAQKSQVEGFINPALLNQRVAQVYKRAFTRGKAGELGDLARIGQMIKPQIPNSGTSQRTFARNLLTANAGTALPMSFVNPVVGGAQAGASALATLANRGIQSRNYNPETVSRALQKYLPKGSKAAVPLSSPLTNLYQLSKE